MRVPRAIRWQSAHANVRIDASGYDPRFDAIAIRGFDITYNGVYLDGLRLVGAGLSVFKTEPYGVDSITVVRGPSSALYGLGSPGGLIDLSSKLPTSQPFHEVQTVFGDRDRIQGGAVPVRRAKHGPAGHHQAA